MAPSYMSPNAGERGEGVAGSHPMSIQLYTGTQINFGDLTSYLTYGGGEWYRGLSWTSSSIHIHS